MSTVVKPDASAAKKLVVVLVYSMYASLLIVVAPLRRILNIFPEVDDVVYTQQAAENGVPVILVYPPLFTR
jgi:hypothetical protein